MPTVDDAIAATAPPPPKGKVDRLLDRLDDDDRLKLVAMLEAPVSEWGHLRLAKILTMMTGEQVSDTTVHMWRSNR